MNNYLISKEQFAEMIAKARVSVGITQRELAKRMKRSVGTVQNWETCLSSPDVPTSLLLFDCLGLNAMRYYYEFIHPDNHLKEFDRKGTEELLVHWIREVASDDELRKMRFNVLGQTGSSWHSQVDLLTAYNNLDLETKAVIANLIYNMYMIVDTKKKTKEEKPNIEELKKALIQAKDAILSGKAEYNN